MRRTIEIAVPSWAEWETIDEDGTITFWKERPDARHSKWFANQRDRHIFQTIETGLPCPKWRESLRVIPIQRAPVCDPH